MTIEETYEHRMKKIIKGVLRNNNIKPKTTDELFTLLEMQLAKEFANAVVADMVEWDTEDNWLKAVTQ